MGNVDRDKMCDENYPDCKDCPYPMLPICLLERQKEQEG